LVQFCAHTSCASPTPPPSQLLSAASS
jgi:hypothetical protein